MSELRKQIEAARAAYLAERYVGDLATDVLDGRARVIVLRRVAGIAAALAAMVVLAVVLWPKSGETSKVALQPKATTQRVVVAEAPTAAETSETFSLTGVEVPDMAATSGMSIVPLFGTMTVTEVPRITDVVPESQESVTTQREKSL